MQPSNHIVIPSWLVGILVTLLLAFVGNIAASLYWAGKIESQQEWHKQQIQEMKDEFKSEIGRLRSEVQRLNYRLIEQANDSTKETKSR